jgi:hypothetical protein
MTGSTAARRFLKAHPRRPAEPVGKALAQVAGILRRMSQITRPNRVRQNLSSRRARLN